MAGVFGVPAVFGARQANPTSKLYIADLNGESQIDNGERIEKLHEKSVYAAQGTVIETQSSSSNTIVLSNGTGVYLAPDTRLEIKRFVQEPFAPNRSDIESEPSISQTHAFLPRGTIGLSTSRLVAGSTMICSTPHASGSIRGGRVLIETTAYETRIFLVEGDVTVRAGESDAGGQLLRGGQQAIIRQPPGQPPQFLVQPTPEDRRAAVDEQVSMASMARSTVYFDVGHRKSGGQEEPGSVFFGDEAEPGEEIVAIPVTPIEPPVDVVDENTASASRIRG